MTTAVQVFEGDGFEPVEQPDYFVIRLHAAEAVKYQRIRIENGVKYRQLTLYAIDRKTAKIIRGVDHKVIEMLVIKDKVFDGKNVMIIRAESFEHMDNSDLGIKLEGMHITVMW